MKIIIFSENNWNSALKYQRHHLADYLAKEERIESIIFCSKVVIRKLTFEDIFVFIKGRLSFRKACVDQRPRSQKIRELSFFLFPYQPFFFPFKSIFRKKFFQTLLSNWDQSEDTVLISYQPFPEFLELMDKIRPRKSIYISIHDYENMTGVDAKVMLVEKSIVNKVDLFSTDSESLYRKITNRDSGPIISLAPGCPLSVVNSARETNYPSRKIGKLIYFGTLASYLDWELMLELTNSGVVVDFMGIEYDVKLSETLPQAKLYKPMDFDNAYAVIGEYDAVLLPYKVNSRNEHIIPAKIYECLSLGLPVFAPNMKWNEVGDFSELLYKYSSLDELIGLIRNFDYIRFSNEKRKNILNLAEENTWERRFNPLKEVILNDD